MIRVSGAVRPACVAPEEAVDTQQDVSFQVRLEYPDCAPLRYDCLMTRDRLDSVLDVLAAHFSHHRDTLDIIGRFGNRFEDSRLSVRGGNALR